MKQFFSVLSFFVLFSISAQTTFTRDLNYIDNNAILTFNDGSYLVSDTDTDGFYTITKKLANGTIDTSYGSNGKVLIPSSYANEQGEEGAGHTTSLKVVGEKFLVTHKKLLNWNIYDQNDVYIKRYLIDGNIDTSFGVNGTFDNLEFRYEGLGHRLLVLEDLSFLEVRYDQLIKYDVDGQIDTSYGNNGVLMCEFGADNSILAVRGNYIYLSYAHLHFSRFDYTNPQATYSSANELLSFNSFILDLELNEADNMILFEDFSNFNLPKSYSFKIINLTEGQLENQFNGDGRLNFYADNHYRNVSILNAFNQYFIAITENDGKSYIMSYNETGHPLTINNEFKFVASEFPVGTDIYDIQKFDATSLIVSTSIGNFKYDIGTGGTNPCPITTTWDGLSWDNGAPDETKNVVVKGALPEITSDIEVCRLKIVSGGSMVIGAGNSLTVKRELVTSLFAPRGTLTIEDGGSLFELDESILNNAYITIKKYSQPMKRLDYTMWSSPTKSTHILGFSPNTLPNRIYIYDGGSGYYNVNASSNPRDVMQKATGYLYRAPNNWNTTNPEHFLGVFHGVPYNKEVKIAVQGTDPDYLNETHYQSIGNPYPSNIDADLFLQTNPSIPTLYFWKNTDVAGGNYATYTSLGGTAAGGGSEVPSGIISVGQGFVVYSIASNFATKDIIFNNSMRVNTPTNFFKTNADKHRIWLDLADENNQKFDQILIGYMNGATNEADAQIDGKTFGNEGNSLYSIINEESFSIQGRALPFENSDVVKLGFKAVEAGKFNISLSNFDGLFAEGEVNVYLKDKQLNTTHNLMESDYNFESDAGEFKDRFEIVYETDEIMGAEDLISNSVQIYNKDKNIVVHSQSEKIQSVELYDLSGKMILKKDNINSNHYEYKPIEKGVLIIKVQTLNGDKVTKKLLAQ